MEGDFQHWVSIRFFIFLSQSIVFIYTLEFDIKLFTFRTLIKRPQCCPHCTFDNTFVKISLCENLLVEKYTNENSLDLFHNSVWLDCVQSCSISIYKFLKQKTFMVTCMILSHKPHSATQGNLRVLQEPLVCRNLESKCKL